MAANAVPSTSTSYTAAVQADNPVGWWRLGEASGTTGDDYANSGAVTDTATYSNLTLAQTGALGGDPDKAASFNDTSSHADIPASADLAVTGTNAFTVEAWVNPSGPGTIYEKAGNTSGSFSVWVRFDNPKVTFALGKEGTAWISATSASSIPLNAWTHLVCTYDGAGVMKVYVDGSLDASGTYPYGATPANSAPAAIGYFHRDNAGFFGGEIDDVAFYRSALSAGRASAHYLAGKALLAPGAQTVDEDTNLALTGFDLINPSGSTDPFTVRVQASNGSATLGTTTGLTFTIGSNGSSDYTFSATETNAKAALNSMSYRGSSNWNGSATLTVTTNGGTGQNPSAAIGITVSPINDPPAAADDTGLTINEEASLTMSSGFGVLRNDSDADGDPLTASLVSSPNGSTTLRSDGGYDFRPAGNFNGTATFTYQACDPSGACSQATVRITVRPVNDNPITYDDWYSTNEDTTLTVPAPGVLGNDVEADGETLTASAGGAWHGTLTLNADGSFTYTPDPNWVGRDSFFYTAWDSTWHASGGSTLCWIDVNPVNDAPTLSGGPYLLTGTDEDTTGGATQMSTILTGLTYVDVDSGAQRGIAVTGKTGNGTWQYSTDGVTWNAIGSVSPTAALLLSGTSRVRYIPDGSNGETALLIFRAWDQTSGTASTNSTRNTADASTNGGTTAFSTGTAQASITVTSVNDAPVIGSGTSTLTTTLANTPSTPETVGQMFLDLGYTDVDTGAITGIAVTAKSGSGSWEYSTDAVTWTGFGAVSDTSALLLSGGSSVRYTGDGHSGETASFVFRAWDRTNALASINGTPRFGDTTTTGGTSAFSTGTATAQISVTAVNRAPTMSAGGITLASTNEDTAGFSQGVFAFLMNFGAADSDGDTMGIAVTGTSGNGTWQYSSTGGSTWASIGAVSGTSALLLGNSSVVRYVPDGMNGETASIAIRTWDQTSGTASTNAVPQKGDPSTNGGSTAFSAATGFANQPVTSVNDAPTLSGGPYSFPDITEEGTGSAIRVSDLLATLTYGDVDSGAQSGIALTSKVGNGNWQYSPNGGVTYNLVGAISDTSTLLLSGDMYIRYLPDQERGETATITFRTWDRTSGSAEQKVNTTGNGGSTAFSTGTASAQIAVSDVNDYPSVTVPGAKTMDEDTSLTITGISISDVDAGSSIIRASVLSFPLGDSVTLSTTTGLTFVSGTNGGDTYTVSGTLGDINTALASLTYQAPANYNSTAFVQINVDDLGNTGGGSLADTGIVNITINPVNDAPVFPPGANQVVLEDSGAQTVPAWASPFGPGGDTDEAGQTLTWTVTNDNNALFSVQPALNASGDLTYTPAADATGSATVTVTLRDDGGTANGGIDTSVSQTFTITVNPVNDVPSFTKGADQTVLEDAVAQTVAGWATALSKGAADEAGETLSFTVTNDNNPLFSVQPAIAANGDLTYTPAVDANGVATVTVSLADNGGTANGGVDTSASQTFTITITSVNDAPSFTKGVDQTVAEDPGSSFPLWHSVPGWATGMGTGPSDEAGQTFSFTVTSDNPSFFSGGAPQVDANGDLGYMLGLDVNGVVHVTVTMVDDGGTANGGVNSFSQTFTITVNPVNDAPVAWVPGAASVVQDANLSLAGIRVSDLDALDTGTFTVEVSLSAPHGTVTLATTSGLTFSVGDGSADTTMTFRGTLSNLNAALATVTYRSSPSYSGSETLTVSVNDLGNTGSGGTLSDSKTVAITVTPRPSDDDGVPSGGGGYSAPSSTPEPTQPPVTTPAPTQTPQGVTPSPTATPGPAGAPMPSPTPVLVVVTPPAVIPVTVVSTNVPAGLPIPGPSGVAGVLSGGNSGVGVFTATPTAWGGSAVELRIDNEGSDRAFVFDPFAAPPEGLALPRLDAVIRSFSLEVYNYDPIRNTASQRTDEEKATAAPVTIRLAVSAGELAAVGTDAYGQPNVSRFELLRVKPGGGVEAVPSTYIRNEGIQPPAGWVVATFVPRSTYLLAVVSEGEKSAYGVLRGDQLAWIEVSYTDGGRYFPATGYSVEHDSFWNYFKKRGGIRTFGYPVSNEVTLDGFVVQLFQRGAMQESANGSVATINMLDESLTPRLNGLEGFPVPDRDLLDTAPNPADADYGRKAIEFVRTHVANDLDGEHVGFLDAYLGTVTYVDAFPAGGGSTELMPLINLEIWGLPTSKPLRDERNHNFIYQRFQRGILHYDATTGTTQGVLLGDAWKLALNANGVELGVYRGR